MDWPYAIMQECAVFCENWLGLPRNLHSTLWEITQPYGLRCRAENSIRKRDAACGSGRAREESSTVDGTGFAGVRG
ncbi:hypothetical protein [Pseudomonas sp. 10-1B]|uniref:hypothetical protein n=1 Tax=Pseudomonas sp. 10-1B TaxID=1546029 RepID=UPI000B0FC9BC|nr:hypothetical protein [Pseudomonas sp. 10-1B]